MKFDNFITLFYKYRKLHYLAITITKNLKIVDNNLHNSYLMSQNEY